MAKRNMRLVLLVLRSELGRSLWNDVCLVSELVRSFALHICRIDLLPSRKYVHYGKADKQTCGKPRFKM